MKFDQLIEASENIGAIKKLGQIAKILRLASMAMLLGFWGYVGYSYFKTKTLRFSLEWGAILFIFILGFFIYGFLSFAFNQELFPASQMVLWAAGIGDVVFLIGAFNSYQTPMVFLGMLVFIFALSAFISRHTKKAIDRIRNK